MEDISTGAPIATSNTSDAGKSEQRHGTLTSITFADLIALDAIALELIFETGRGPSVDGLGGKELRGFNISPVAVAGGFQYFIKGFVDPFDPPPGTLLEGYNRWVGQGPNDKWIPRNRRPHGFFLFRAQRDGQAMRGPGNTEALAIDYAGSRRNHRLNPERLIRDYLVRVGDEGSGLYLGAAYLGPAAFRQFSNFFVLEEIGAATYRFAPER